LGHSKPISTYTTQASKRRRHEKFTSSQADVWTFSTPTERYFLRRGPNKEVVDEVLGESFNGVLVSDFYAAYPP